MQILAVMNDLLFRSKIEAAAAAAGATVRVATNAPSLERGLSGGPLDLAIVDLEGEVGDISSLLARIRSAQPAVAIVGYCAHGQAELQEQARRAGCAWVGARSAFVHALPGWVSGHAPAL